MSEIEKMTLESESLIDDRLNKLKELMPEVFSESGIDFDKLRLELGDEVDEGLERYAFTWPGKADAIRQSQMSSTATLRPRIEKSRSRDGEDGSFDSDNIYIEGDNLEVLKLLQRGYHGKVKMIYIDPPYNTGHDFVYKDNFGNSVDNYKEQAGLAGQSNADTSGRYHSDWCSMMYPRLRLARELLTDDGVIFISIDDNEDRNLRILCDEVFGEANFVSQLIWERAYSPKNDAKYVSNSHDYVLVYAKSIERFVIGRLPRTDEANARYKNPDNDPRGVWKPSDLSVKTYSPDSDYPITTPSGRVVEPPAGRCWKLSRNAFRERLQDNRIWFGPNGDSVPCIKRFLTELKYDGMAPTSIMFYKEVGHSQEGAKELVSLFDGKGYFPLLPSITSDCCRLDDYVSLHYLLKHMAHLVQAAVWTAGLDDRLTDSGLISFQLCKAYAPPVGVKGQISTVCLYTAGGNLASKDNFILFYLGRFDGGTVFRCIMISPGKVFLGRIEDEGEIRFQQLRPRFLQCLFQYNRGQ